MKENTKNILVLICLSYVFFMFGNSILSLTNPDEVFYTLTAKEMAIHKTWMTPILFDQPQFEKPIMLYWLIRIALLSFKNVYFAARFFPALFGILGVLAVYYLSLLFFNNKRKAFLCSLVLLSAGLYIGMSRTVFTDLIFSVFILLSFTSFYLAFSNAKKKSIGILLFYFFASLAVLTKGPLGFIIPFIAVSIFLILKKRLNLLFSWPSLFGAVILILVSLPWYQLMFAKYGASFTKEFFYNDHYRRLLEAEHLSNDTWFFYPGSIIACAFPWSLFVLFSIILLFKKLKSLNDVELFLSCWIVAVFLIFQVAHSKLISYILPLFPAICVLAGEFIYNAIYELKFRRLFFISYFTTLIIPLLMPFGLIFAAFKYSQYLPNRLSVYLLVLLLISWLTLTLSFFFKKKYVSSIVVLAFFILNFFLVVPLIKGNLEPYLSSRNACKLIEKEIKPGDTILASKFLARGVRFYTGNSVAVLDMGGKGFFSAHPIPFINTDEKAVEFLSKRKAAFAIVEDTGYGYLKNFSERRLVKISELAKVGDSFILKLNYY